MKFRITLLFLIMLTVNTNIFAADPPVSVETTLSSDSAKIGEVFNYSVKVTWDSINVDKVEIQDLNVKDEFEVIKTIQEKIKNQSGEKSQATEYQLMAFEEGELSLPQIEVKYTLKNSSRKSEIEKSKTLKINITDIPPDNAEAPDLREREITFTIAPSNNRKYFLAALVLIFIVLASILIYLWLRKRDQPVFTRPPPLRPIEAIAIEKIDTLVASNLIEEKRVREFFENLSMILREYLGHRFQFNAVDLTSAEMQVSMGEFVNTMLIEKLADFDNRSDLAKFAEWMPSEKEIESLVRIARELIWDTIPQAGDQEKQEEQEEDTLREVGA